jgi:alkylation response protein AidB-like acyl-CoA dehydrogenase
MHDPARLDTELLRRIYRAGATIAPLTERIEAERRLPPEALAALVEAGAFKMALPDWLGGHAAGLPTVLAAIEATARADASAGWVVMIGVTSSLMAGWLDTDTTLSIFGPDDAVTSGVFAPMGRAAPVTGGYRVTGQWPFASGCEHARHRMVGAFVEDGGPLRFRCFLFNAEQTTVVDTWRVSGLCGTGSHDLVIDGAFVPPNRCFSLVDDPPRPIAPLLSVPVFGVLAAGIAAVSLGIAHSAIEALTTLATRRPSGLARRALAQRELVQLAVARAEAKRSAARAWLMETAQAAILAASEGEDPVPVGLRARLRNAACHAVSESAAAVDLMYEAGGGASIYESNPLQRHFRDVHVATQHLMVTPSTQGLIGRIMLGLETDTSRV